MMNCKNPIGLAILVLSFASAYAENIDPNQDNSQYAYGENIGWVNFEPNVAEPNVGATVNSDKLTGFVWTESIGWINLSPASYGGVFNDGAGNLSGYAWGENVGWINFNSADLSYYNVKVCKVNSEDLANFVDDWLLTGDLDADLSGNDRVDFTDYNIFASYWLNYCPDDWHLKTIVP